MSKFNDRNCRFCFNWPDTYDDLPDQANVGTVLWDRQEKRVVLEIKPAYARAVMLESGESPETRPFQNLEWFFNNLSNAGLESEGIPGTK